MSSTVVQDLFFLRQCAQCQDAQTQGRPEGSELQKEAGIKVLADDSCMLTYAYLLSCERGA